MEPSTTSLLILLAVIVLFVWNRLPVGAVAVLASLALFATGVLSADQALSGFGDPVVVFIASLFVVSEGIDSAGVTTWAGQKLLDLIGDRFWRADETAAAILAGARTSPRRSVPSISRAGLPAGLVPWLPEAKSGRRHHAAGSS